MRTRISFSIAATARRLVVLAIGTVLLGATVARADSLQSRQTVVDLISQADTIIRGNVVGVTDGIDANNLPYTEIKVQMRYAPPAGRVGAALATIFGQSGDRQVREDLRRFKQMMEAGEMANPGVLAGNGRRP